MKKLEEGRKRKKGGVRQEERKKSLLFLPKDRKGEGKKPGRDLPGSPSPSSTPGYQQVAQFIHSRSEAYVSLPSTQ